MLETEVEKGNILLPVKSSSNHRYEVSQLVSQLGWKCLVRKEPMFFPFQNNSSCNHDPLKKQKDVFQRREKKKKGNKS